jgi:Ca-activated chloride channel family protein
MMKKALFLFLLAFLLPMIVISAQSGRTRVDNSNEKRVQPTPAPTPLSPDNDPDKNLPKEDEVLKISTDLVSIPVSVLDRRGRYIFDLRRDEFQIFEDGKPQEITFFANTEQPFTVVLMLDISLSTKFQIADIQNAAIAFVSQLRAQDKLMVVAFSEDVYMLTEFTNDRQKLTRAIRSTKFQQGTSLYDAFDYVIHDQLQYQSGRKAIVLFSDGVDTTSKKAWLEKNLRDADELDALVFPIEYDTYGDVNKMEREGTGTLPPGEIRLPLPVPVVINTDKNKRTTNDPEEQRRKEEKTPGISSEDYQKAREYLKALAERTAGRLQRAESIYDLQGAFGQIAQELRQQYSIGYYPPDIDKTGVPRKIKVKVDRPNVVVKARDTYTIGEPEKKKKKKG